MSYFGSPLSPDDRVNAPLSPCSPSYYGVYVGSPDPDGEVRKHVYSDKLEALKVAKKCKASRFKVFYSLEEAENFSLNGPKFITSPISFGAEKYSPYKTPISQELVRFRKCIERGDFESVKKSVNLNPRYLVSSGDTPAILQEGARYNALHIAAKFDRPNICEFILECISSFQFIQKLYGEEDIKDTVKHGCDILVDLYLNTPDKAANETPLHFASKIGALDVIKVLVSYDKCDKNRRNKEGKTALEVVGSRKDISSDVKTDIVRLLSSDYYVAVFRPQDPIRPSVLEGPFIMASPSKPNLEKLLDSEMRMSGVAGPMKYEEAINFKKLWKRTRGSPLSTPKSPCSPPPLVFSPSSFKKPDKIIERIGRDLCAEMDVPWIEYWPFLGDFANFSNDKGLALLEKYFASRFNSEKSKGSGDKMDDSLDSLYNDFRKLEIKENSGSKSLDNSSNPFAPCNFTFLPKFDCNLSYSHIDKTCQVYANRLSDSLMNLDFQSFRITLNKCQDLITSCATDRRYCRVEFNRIHSKLALLVKKRVREDNASNLPRYIEFLTDFVNQEGVLLKQPIFCMCRKLLGALNGNFEDPYRDPEQELEKSPHEESVRFRWLLLDPCQCMTDIEYKPSKKRLDFRDRSFKHYSEEDTGFNNKQDRGTNDGNDSDCSFQTPPTSPRLIYRRNSNDTLQSNSSEDSTDEEMFSADEGIPVAIEGNTLKEIDRTVYEALDQDKVNQSKHPYTYQWMQECKRKFEYSCSTPLVLSPLSPLYLKKCENIKMSLKEHILNNSPVSSK